MQLRLTSRRETSNTELPESSKLDFPKKFHQKTSLIRCKRQDLGNTDKTKNGKVTFVVNTIGDPLKVTYPKFLRGNRPLVY